MLDLTDLDHLRLVAEECSPTPRPLTTSAMIVGGDPGLTLALAGQLDVRGTKAITVTDGRSSGSPTVRNLQCDT